jgi:hypothetical protein
MAYSNVRSRKFSAGSDRLRKMLLLVLFLSAMPGSARAQLVEQDVFTTPSYDVECTFALAQSGGLRFLATVLVKGTCASFLVRRGMHIS